MKNVAFLTGLPHFFAYKLLKKLLNDDYFIKIYVLIDEKHIKKLYKYMNNNLSASQASRIFPLKGNITAIDLGLSGKEYTDTIKEVTHIYHLAGRYFYGMEERLAYELNITGTQHIIELAINSKKLARFNYYSTVFISGNHEGTILEDKLIKPKKFNNHYEEIKFEAESLVRSYMHKIPTTIYRPSIIIGDSHDTKMTKFKGPYYLIKLLIFSSLRIPVPKNGTAPINIVPIDFVINALYHISLAQQAVNKTFHLVDPNPMSFNQITELLASKRKYYKMGNTLSFTLNQFFKLPILKRLLINQKTAFEFVYHNKTYSTMNTLELLDGTGIKCPPLKTYIHELVHYMKEIKEKKKDTSLFKTDEL